MYNIICHDGKSFEITSLQKDAIYRLSGSNAKGVDIDGEFIFFGNIARIEKGRTEEEYTPISLNDTIKSFNPNRRKHALNSMIKGFKKYFSGREIPAQSQELLDNMLKHYGSCN